MITIRDLIQGDCLNDGERLVWFRKRLNLVHLGIISTIGTITTEDGEVHRSPSGAAKHLSKRPVDGWLAWKLEDSGESLASVRARFLLIQ